MNEIIPIHFSLSALASPLSISASEIMVPTVLGMTDSEILHMTVSKETSSDEMNGKSQNPQNGETVPVLRTASTMPLAAAPRLIHNITPENLREARTEIQNIIGEENISTSSMDRDRHTSSKWSSHPPNDLEQPSFIVFPRSTEDTSSIMKICHGRLLPVVAFSGGTSLEGHYANTRQGISINFSRMSSIIQLHKQDFDVVVQPGVRWEHLNEVLAQDNLFFPPDPGHGALIGGMIATGCSGTNAYHYGTIRDWVISLTVVLADGTVIKTRQRPRKSSAGYDLTRTFIGSEGTLGLVTEAVLKVTTKPPIESVAVASFSTYRAATECVISVVSAGIKVAAVELLDELLMRMINESGATSRTWQEAPTLFFKFAGLPEGVHEQIAIVKKLVTAGEGLSFDFAADTEEADKLWLLRKQSLIWAMGLKKNEDDNILLTDVAVPISHLATIIEEAKADIKESGLVGGVVGHVGDGNFHVGLSFSEKERPVAEAVVDRMVRRAIEMEGTISGEHGIGIVKRDSLVQELGQDTVDLMRMVNNLQTIIRTIKYAY